MTTRKSSRLLFSRLTALAVVLVAGCSSEEAGLRELKRLCQKDAGLTIYRTVKADGYYDAYSGSGWGNALINGPYMFYEYCDDSPSPSKHTVIPEPGCYRLTKVSRDSGQCYERIDQSLSRFVVDPYPEFLKSHCIKVEKVENPMAVYVYKEWHQNWRAKNNRSEFIRTEASIEEANSQKIIGQYVSYSYNDNPRHSSPQSCNFIDGKYPSFAETKLIEAVIISTK